MCERDEWEPRRLGCCFHHNLLQSSAPIDFIPPSVGVVWPLHCGPHAAAPFVSLTWVLNTKLITSLVILLRRCQENGAVRGVWAWGPDDLG